MTRTRTIHYCDVCGYKTNRKYDRDKHVTRMHGSNRIPVIENKIIPEAIQIDHVPHHEPLPSVQHGCGVVREQDNQAYNDVVEIAHSWKNVCKKIQEEKLVKDNAIKIRDELLFNQNNKIQEEFNKNKNLHL